MPKDYDFAGWVTKNDILCSDGVTIKQDAFRGDTGRKVPLVWNHNYSSPENVLGHVILEHHDKGTYGYGYFNDTQKAQDTKELVLHGDIVSMSIGAKNIKKRGSDVIHGAIYEVSLVLAAANPGALIEPNLVHGADGEFTESDSRASIYTGQLIHSKDDIITQAEDTEGGDPTSNNDSDESTEGEDKTIEDVLKTMNEEQLEAVHLLVGSLAESITQSDDENELENNETGDDTMKHNVFNGGSEGTTETTLTHSDLNKAIKNAKTNKTMFKDELIAVANEAGLQHAEDYGIKNIEVLFPEATALTKTPEFYKDRGTAYREILNGVSKSPFQKVKMWLADLTEDEARARGYMKGNQKFDQVFKIFSRETSPQTIYKRQKLDRDDIIDVEDFDVVAWIQSEMREQLEEEIARAILIGDGRELMSPDKIKEDKIIPIINDHEFFTIKAEITSDEDFMADVIAAMVDYKGSGSPTMYIDPYLAGRLRMLKATDGRYLYGNLPATNDQLANYMGVSKIVPTTFMLGKGALIVNLSDYRIGAAKGGQITNFDDFDIDFNQYKYLIETRLSGALVAPFSAIHLAETASTSPARVLPHAKGFFNEDGKGMKTDVADDGTGTDPEGE